jgi:predicted secreted protein
MIPHPRLSACALVLVLSLAGKAFAVDLPPAEAQTIEFSTESSQPAPNDLAVAVLFAEHSAADAAAVARVVNQRIAAALASAREVAEVKAQSAGTSTWPVYEKDGQGRISAWRMRSEIRLESRNLAAMSALVGTLQTELALAQVSMQPAPETRRKAADEATVAAIRSFEQRAALIAATLGKRYRIRHLSIGDSGVQPPPYPRLRAAPAMMAEAAPAPLEGGESQIGVNVSGRIELID